MTSEKAALFAELRAAAVARFGDPAARTAHPKQGPSRPRRRRARAGQPAGVFHLAQQLAAKGPFSVFDLSLRTIAPVPRAEIRHVLQRLVADGLLACRHPLSMSNDRTRIYTKP